MKKKEITIINLGINNIKKIITAFEYLNANVKITESRKDILNADRLLLPGLGAFNSGMHNLNKFQLVDDIYEFIFNKKKPIFGICLGMQLFFEYSEEFEKTKGLGFLEGNCKKLETSKNNFINIPHIGWKKVIFSKNINSDSIFEESFSSKDNFFYFVHSFFVKTKKIDIISGKTLYGKNNFCSAIEKDNILETQFHPELSGKKGLNILDKFLKI